MNITTDTTTVAKDRIDFRPIQTNEPEWIYRLRKNAWEKYLELPLPERVQNIWRYTAPESFLAKNIDALMNLYPVVPDGSNGKPYPVTPEYAAIGYNLDNRMTVTKLTPETSAKGVVFKDIYSALRENEGFAGRFLGKLVGASFGKFEALNLALWNTGFFLYIPDNTVIERPILMNRHPGGQFTMGRLLVVVGRNSEVTVIDDYAGECRLEDPSANSVVEIFVGDSSRVRYVNLQRLSSKCTSYITQRGQVETGGSLYSIFGAMGGSLSKVNAGTILNGKGADSRMYGVLFGDEARHFDYHTMHHHKASESFSNIDFKVILKDKANSAYTGLIRIEKETANCEAYQENRNLLLNKGTRAESIPELEILADQVRCTHGATMGPIDPEMLFYLESRGVARSEAVKMIVGGFVEPTISQIPSDLQPLLRNLVLDKLGSEL
jgi:Fe-S cluster assembly protein SufD